MTEPAPNTVVISQVDGWWIWMRYIAASYAVVDDNGNPTGEIAQRLKGAMSLFPYADSATALVQAKLVNADLADSAFSVSS